MIIEFIKMEEDFFCFVRAGRANRASRRTAIGDPSLSRTPGPPTKHSEITLCKHQLHLVTTMDLVRLELNRSPRPKDSPVPPPLLNSTTCVLFLSCGRRLAYCEWGARDSPHVLIYFNGILGSRLEGALADSTAREQGVRLISCDRPGIGLSDLDRKATVRSVAEDAVELIDRVIGKERKVALHASSGGAPYACAACGILKERVIALFLAAPVGRGLLEGQPV